MTGGSYGAVAEGQRLTVTARPSTTETNSPSMNSGSRRVGVRWALESTLETGGSLEMEGGLETRAGDPLHATATPMRRRTPIDRRNDRVDPGEPSIEDQTMSGRPRVREVLTLGGLVLAEHEGR
jgi:hypothetical protein